MKRYIYFVLLIYFVVVLLSINVNAQPTIYLVRHAEKIPAWVGRQLDAYHPLSADGVATASVVSNYFKSKKIHGIYSSTTTRTLHTAFPLSESKKIAILTEKACMDTSAIDGFLKKLNKEFGAEQSVVLFSHSNIIPYLLIKSGLRGACYKDAGIVMSDQTTWLLIQEYDHIWKIEPGEPNKRKCSDFQRIKFK